MTCRSLLLGAALALCASAGAQSTLPDLSPVSVATTTAAPNPALADVTVNLFVPSSVSGPFTVNLTARNARPAPITFSFKRVNEQGCAFAPTIRVLRVGTREVVYPQGPSGRLCTQELLRKTAPARGLAAFTRPLTLPSGDYLIEGWIDGFADGVPFRQVAKPVRVTVR